MSCVDMRRTVHLVEVCERVIRLALCQDAATIAGYQGAFVALSIVSSKRTTFTHPNVLAEVHRQLHVVRFISPADRLRAGDHTTTLALQQAVHLNPAPATEPVPAETRRRGHDGSRLRPGPRPATL